jgi:hypothetical protein
LLVFAEGVGGLVQKGETVAMLAEPSAGRGPVAGTRSSGLRVRRGDTAGCCGEMDDADVVFGEGGDVGLADEHAGDRVYIALRTLLTNVSAWNVRRQVKHE